MLYFLLALSIAVDRRVTWGVKGQESIITGHKVATQHVFQMICDAQKPRNSLSIKWHHINESTCA